MISRFMRGQVMEFHIEKFRDDLNKFKCHVTSASIFVFVCMGKMTGGPPLMTSVGLSYNLTKKCAFQPLMDCGVIGGHILSTCDPFSI